jgi:toxin ParE1/3/4
VKPEAVVPGEQAVRDVEEIVEYFLSEGAEAAALEFIDDLEKAYVHIGRHPASGSPRGAHELNRPGVRAWVLTRYPCLISYAERADSIDIWRVLHGERDIPFWLRDTG